MEQKTKRGFITNQQKEIMVEYLKKNPDLTSGKFSNSFTFKDAARKWNELADLLNSTPGCKKDWKNWRKTWQDLRSRTKTKKSKNIQYRGGTGGGPYVEEPLTKQDEDILDIIKLVSIEGHKSVAENDVVFEFGEIDKTNKTVIDTEANQDALHNFEIPIPNDNNTPSNTPKKCTPNKIPKRRSKVMENSSAAMEFFKKTYGEKVYNKENYYQAKLEILKKIAESKERSARAKERIADALEIISVSNTYVKI